jgi:hypothetical protein
MKILWNWRLAPATARNQQTPSDFVETLEEFAQFGREIFRRRKVRGQRLSYRAAHHRLDLGGIGGVMDVAWTTLP